MRQSILFGPLLGHSGAAAAATRWNPRILPLNRTVEWATPHACIAIPLFACRQPRSASHGLRLHELLFKDEALPFDTECPEYQAIEMGGQQYWPLESLLVGLYEGYNVCRPINELLADLSRAFHLYSGVRSRIQEEGLLTPEAESLGFRLNMIVRDQGRVFGEITWQPSDGRTRFATRVFEVRARDTAGASVTGQWVPPSLISIGQVLSRELRRVVSGGPENVLSKAGWHAVKAALNSDR